MMSNKKKRMFTFLFACIMCVTIVCPRTVSGYEAEIMDHCSCPYVRVLWRCCQNPRTR